MNFIKIGDKVISLSKISEKVEKILEYRALGLSQQEVAKKMSLDRAFISKLEKMGEIRRGESIAVIGFPIKNKEELTSVLAKYGVNFIMLLSEKERLDYVTDISGVELFNKLMDVIAEIKNYDLIIFLGSNKRVKLVESLFDTEVIAIEIGTSPLKEDVYVPPEKIIKVLDYIKKNKGAVK